MLARWVGDLFVQKAGAYCTTSPEPDAILRKPEVQRKVVQLSEPNRKGELSRWRKEAWKKKDRDRKRKERRRKARPLSNHNF